MRNSGGEPLNDQLDPASTFAPTRRWVGKAIAAGAVLSALPVGPIAIAQSRPRAFQFIHGADVMVHVGNGERFTVRTLSSTGDELERFEQVTAASLNSLKSRHFTVREVAVPA